jgi:hypothetical protein
VWIPGHSCRSRGFRLASAAWATVGWIRQRPQDAEAAGKPVFPAKQSWRPGLLSAERLRPGWAPQVRAWSDSKTASENRLGLRPISRLGRLELRPVSRRSRVDRCLASAEYSLGPGGKGVYATVLGTSRAGPNQLF